jgi:hypothetical protein
MEQPTETSYDGNHELGVDKNILSIPEFSYYIVNFIFFLDSRFFLTMGKSAS